MRLTRSVKETIFERMQKDAEFTEGVSDQARELCQRGKMTTAILLQKDLEECPHPMLPERESFAPFNVAEYLETPDDMDGYLEACRELDPGDGSLVRKAEQNIALAVARLSGIKAQPDPAT